jgi:hypothetical protein
MHRPNRWLVAGLIAASMGLPGCATTAAEEAAAGGEDAATVVAVEGSDLSRVILKPEAAERIGVRTEQVRLAPATVTATVTGAGAAALTVIPAAALLYDKDGKTWAFTSPEPLTFVRQAVTVSRIAGDVVVLRSGPAVGTAVVTVGAAELLGAEYGVEGE